MKKITRNTFAIIVLTIGATRANAQLTSDSPSPALKPAATVAAAKPAAELQTASSFAATASEAKKSAANTVVMPSQGGMQEPAPVMKAAVAAPVLPSQEGLQPNPAVKAVE
jgi:hypothetical protein